MLAFWTDMFQEQVFGSVAMGQINELLLYGVRRMALHLGREGVRIGRRGAGLGCKLGEGAE